jgi:putative Mg2+ transporter-C (MgtC) family protein
MAMDMPLHPGWSDIAIRLAFTMAAGAIIGFNRGARGHAAGFRTTILVGLAASVAMIQTNILLSMEGKTSGSFAVMDLMRLPLGILTGVGFIGGGAILKKGDLVTGVTTAATLWLVTVIGLCLGGGQLVDIVIPRQHRAALTITCDAQWDVAERLTDLVRPLHYRARFHKQRQSLDSATAEYSFEISWQRAETAAPPLDLLRLVEKHFSVKSFELTTENGK